jgi:hypothetical protein
MNRQTGIGLTIAVGVALVAIVLWLPRKSADAEQLTALPTEAVATDDPVEAAVQKCQARTPWRASSHCAPSPNPSRPM